MIELERGATRGDPEREAKTWLDKLSEVDRQRSRAQDMAIQGLLDYDELRAKLASLEETRKTAEREMIVLRSHQERLAELERYKETVLKHYAAITPEALDSLSSEERRQLYKMLRLKSVQYPDGSVEAEVSGAPIPSLSATESTCSSTCLP